MTRRECQLASARRRDNECPEPGWSTAVGVASVLGVALTVIVLLVYGGLR